MNIEFFFQFLFYVLGHNNNLMRVWDKLLKFDCLWSIVYLSCYSKDMLGLGSGPKQPAQPRGPAPPDQQAGMQNRYVQHFFVFEATK